MSGLCRRARAWQRKDGCLKLLLDENLSRRMVALLESYFPESTHVCLVGLQNAQDAEIWSYAGQHDFVIVTRDSDFSDMAAFYGPPPKFLHLGIRNCRWREMAVPLIQNHVEVLLELERPDVALVELP